MGSIRHLSAWDVRSVTADEHWIRSSTVVVQRAPPTPTIGYRPVFRNHWLLLPIVSDPSVVVSGFNARCAMTADVIGRALWGALMLASEGRRGFPCAGSKRPTSPRGFHDVSADPTFRSLILLFWIYPGATATNSQGESGRYSNRSLCAIFRRKKMLGEARDWAGIFGDTVRQARTAGKCATPRPPPSCPGERTIGRAIVSPARARRRGRHRPIFRPICAACRR
jgi:hypothetical protein